MPTPSLAAPASTGRLPQGEISLYHLKSGKALDSDGAALYFRAPNGDGYQYWVFEPHPGGYTRLRHRHSGHLLTHDGASGVNVRPEIGPDDPRQLWRPEPLEENRYLRLSSVSAPGRVLDGNGEALYLHPANDDGYQKWSYVEHYDTANWLGSLDDKRPINQVSIPGTHDSGTATVGPDGAPTPRDCSWYDLICQAQNTAEQVAWLAKQTAYTAAGGAWAQCQTMTIGQQLAGGIRFLDVRCRHFNNTLLIHHGTFYCNLSFADVVGQCVAFLKQHPTETILMSVKDEGNGEGNTDGRSFGQLVLDILQEKAQPNDLSFRSDYAPLGELRGKIQLVRRFNDTGTTFPKNAAGEQPKGIDADGVWQDDAVTHTDWLRVQDVYNVKLQGKVQKAQAQMQLLAESLADPRGRALYLNFLSGFALETPAAFALANNHVMYLALLALPAGRRHLGVLPMDFPPSYLVNAIIQSNFD